MKPTTIKVPTSSLILEATLCLLLATSSVANAAPSVLIDLGSTGAGNVTGTVGSVTYNDLSIATTVAVPDTGNIPVVLNGGAATTAAQALKDTDNNTLAWTIELDLISTGTAGEWGNNGANSNDLAAPYPPSLSTIAANALKDNLYMNRAKRGLFTLAGLDNSKTYNIRFYGSGEGGTSGDNDQNLIPVTGTGVDFVSTAWNSLLNKTIVVEWDDVAPASGVIAFDYQADREGWMNFMSIEEVPSGGANAYADWSGGPASDIDTNGDGVKNGVAWALGAADPNANAISLLPALDNTTDPTYLLFTFNRSDAANADPNTAITVEYGNDLVGWTTAVDDNDNVEIEVTGGTPKDAVVVKIKRSTLGATGKIFVRLKVVVATP